MRQRLNVNDIIVKKSNIFILQFIITVHVFLNVVSFYRNFHFAFVIQEFMSNQSAGNLKHYVNW